MEIEESSALGCFCFGSRIVFLFNLAAMAIPFRIRNAFFYILWLFFHFWVYDTVFDIVQDLYFTAS